MAARWGEIGLVTGAHRSGTTWVGKALASSVETFVAHEPFNRTFGLRCVDDWYPSPTQEAARRMIHGGVLELTEGKAQFKHWIKADRIVWNLARLLVGTRSTRNYRAGVRGTSSRLIMKDPFLLRAAPFLSKEMGIKSVVIVKHPAAYLQSLKRMGWEPPLLEGNSAASGNNLSTKHTDLTAFAFDVGVFLDRIYGPVLDIMETGDSNIFVVRHEDLCRDPVGWGGKVAVHLNVKDRSNVKEYFRESSVGKTSIVPDDSLHSLVRDSATLVENNRSLITREESRSVLLGAARLASVLYAEETV